MSALTESTRPKAAAAISRDREPALVPSARTARTLPGPTRTPTLQSFVDELLEQQQSLTAVDRFAQRHERQDFSTRFESYRDLIPLDRPRPGEQYAFVVELDRCSGCKACVSACHSLNGLEENETWRSVGLLVGVPAPAGSGRAAAGDAINLGPQHVTAACHHCLEPACADGCPVLAYEKDAITGIVRHLDDQCIGCRYCVLMCPYDVPKYSSTKGIIRKCDLCHDRLAAGEAPACVQACPHEAIRIEFVSPAAVRAAAAPGTRLVPGAFDSACTLPTTRYHSSRPFGALTRPADAELLRLEEPHWPLVFMLVLTQLAGGMHVLHAALLAGGRNSSPPGLTLLALTALLTGLTVSVAHLGRPLKAWRAFLGWRRSWMSREIIAFGAYAAFAVWLSAFPGSALLANATALIALGGIACSVMIYVDTQRPAWSASVVSGTFFGTTLLLGATAGAAWAGWVAPALAPTLATVAAIIRAALFGWEWTLLRARHDPESPRHRAALTVWRLLRPVLVVRTVLFVASTAFSILAIFNVAQRGAIWGTLAAVTTFTTQVLERYTFFAACPAPRMPGGVRT